MGRAVAQQAEGREGVSIVGGLDRSPDDIDAVFPVNSLDDACQVLGDCDVIIDFSAPEFLRDLLKSVDGRSDVALVIGTTGLGTEEEKLIDAHAENAPVLTAANFSAGVNVLLSLVEDAARVLNPGYDIEIVETHHRRKEDAPSGTALALGRAAAAGREVDLDDVRTDGRSGRPGARTDAEIGMHALRGGDVIGDHTVHLIGDFERIELTHRASDRGLFADGALRAAEWIRGRDPGRYTMRQVLGL